MASRVNSATTHSLTHGVIRFSVNIKNLYACLMCFNSNAKYIPCSKMT